MSAPKLTERIVSELLRDKFTRTGNGGSGEYAYMAGVRNDAGFNATRTFDGLVMSLWPSRGLRIEVLEIKVSRSDWQRELSKPQKAEDACQVADRFWIVAPVGCVHPGELPPTWGLIEITGDGTDERPWRLRTKTAAPDLRPGAKRGPLDRGLVVGMLRSVPGAVPGSKLPGPTDQALAKARDEGREQGRAEAERKARQSWSSPDDDARQWNELQAALREHGIRFSNAAQLASDLAVIQRQAAAVATIGYVRDHLARVVEQLDELDATGQLAVPA